MVDGLKSDMGSVNRQIYLLQVGWHFSEFLCIYDIYRTKIPTPYIMLLSFTTIDLLSTTCSDTQYFAPSQTVIHIQHCLKCQCISHMCYYVSPCPIASSFLVWQKIRKIEEKRQKETKEIKEDKQNVMYPGWGCCFFFFSLFLSDKKEQRMFRKDFKRRK